MKIQPQTFGALAAFAVGVAALPLIGLASPTTSHAEDNCDFNYYLNTVTDQCQFCDGAVMYWEYNTNVCLPLDPTVYVDPNPILGPVGPVGVGPDPIVGPVGPGGIGRR